MEYASPILAAETSDMLSSFRTFSRQGTPGGLLSADGGMSTGPPCEPGPQEQAIQRALYAGNFSAAVDAALEVLLISFIPSVTKDKVVRIQNETSHYLHNCRK